MGPPSPPIDGAPRGGAPLPRVAKPATARYLGPVDVAPLMAFRRLRRGPVWRGDAGRPLPLPEP